jgi:hypothetical protein
MRGGSRLTEEAIVRSETLTVGGESVAEAGEEVAVGEEKWWLNCSSWADCGFSRFEKSTAEAGRGM